MNYEIIKDEVAFKEFIDWLPKCEPEEMYYLSLLARKKYDSEDSNLHADKNQLKRNTSTTDRIFEKVRQMECALGSYTFRDRPISQQALALYISSNPRNLKKASYQLLKRMAQKLCDNEFFNPQAEAYSVIQVTNGLNWFFDVDVDFKDKDHKRCEYLFCTEVINYVNREAVTLIRSRGGFHCLIEYEKINEHLKNKWYRGINSMGNDLYDITMNGSGNLLPVVGCTQGGFVPYFFKNW